MQNATPNPAENSRYGFTNTDRDKLTIGPSIVNHFCIAVEEVGEIAADIIRIPNDQAPAVALAILTAAGFEPSGSNEPSGLRESVETAAGYLDDAVHLAKGAAAAKELTKRRDELAQEFIPHIPGITYDKLATNGIKRAIDMIISLQDEATK